MASTDTFSDGGRTSSTRRESDSEVRSSSVYGGSSDGVVGRCRARNEGDEKGGGKKRVKLEYEVPSDCGKVAIKGGMDDDSAKSVSKSTSITSSSSCPKKTITQCELDTAIVTAVDDSNIALVKRLVKRGASLESTDKNGYPLLMSMCTNWLDIFPEQDQEIFNFLISKGALVNAVHNEHGYTALHTAAMYDCGNYVESLLNAGADQNIQDNLGLTALMQAIRFGSSEIARTLVVTASSNLSIRDNKGFTAMRHAADCHSGEMDVRQLLAAGADPNTADNEGITPLMDAAKSKFGILRALLEFGANLNSQNSDGETALQIAARWGDKRILMSLIVAGADINTKDKHGWTTLKWAVDEDHRSIAALLLMEGASDDGDEAYNLAVEYNRPYGNRDAWEGMKGRMTVSQIKTALSSALAASTAPLVDTPTTPLQNFFHKPESLKMMERIVSFFQGPEDPRFSPKPYSDDESEDDMNGWTLYNSEEDMNYSDGFLHDGEDD